MRLGTIFDMKTHQIAKTKERKSHHEQTENVVVDRHSCSSGHLSIFFSAVTQQRVDLSFFQEKEYFSSACRGDHRLYCSRVQTKCVMSLSLEDLITRRIRYARWLTWFKTSWNEIIMEFYVCHASLSTLLPWLMNVRMNWFICLFVSDSVEASDEKLATQNKTKQQQEENCILTWTRSEYVRWWDAKCEIVIV